MAKDKNSEKDDDQLAFQAAMRGVKPLKQKQKVDLTPPVPVARPAKPREEDEETGFEFSDYEKLPLVDTEETLYFAKPGIQHKILRKLRQGQYNVEARLDLHGNTVAEARILLGRFLLRCQQQGLRHVLIVHGKGRTNTKPILKNKLNHWLRQTDQVLAFCSATAKDGRSGALYVLLRRDSIG